MEDKTTVRQFFSDYSPDFKLTDYQIQDRIIDMAMSDDPRQVNLSVKLHRAWYGKCPVGMSWEAN